MKRLAFLSIVPRAVQFWALVTVGCAALIGLVAGHQAADPGAVLRTMFLDGVAALLAGIMLATWILGVGFVFADARRRAMRPLPWVLVAILFPHLLGFLLYFVMRQPIASTCASCGQTIPINQQFCSWCGNPQTLSAIGDGPLAGHREGAGR